MATLETRRIAAEEQLTALREARTRALIRDEPFDAAAIVEAEQLLAGLAEAEAVAARQERVAVHAAAEQRDKQTVENIAALEEQRLGAVARAQAAAENLGQALAEVSTIAAEMEKTVGELTQRRLNRIEPTSLQAAHLPQRLTRGIAEVLSRHLGGAPSFGHFRLQAAGGETAVGDDWAAAERAGFAGHLEWLRRIIAETKLDA